MYYHPYGYQYQTPNYMNGAMYNYGGLPSYSMYPNGAIQANQFDFHRASNGDGTGNNGFWS